MMRFGVSCVLVAMALLLAAPAQAQLYRCKKGGTIVFTEFPCGPDAEYRSLDGQAPSAADREAAQKRAAADNRAAVGSAKVEAELAARRERIAAVPARPAEDIAAQARACVEKYRPHLAYQGVSILGQRIETDGFGRTLYVDVRTITNPNTPIRIDPILLRERFICRLTPQGGIDERYTEDYVEKHKRGQRL